MPEGRCQMPGELPAASRDLQSVTRNFIFTSQLSVGPSSLNPLHPPGRHEERSGQELKPLSDQSSHRGGVRWVPDQADGSHQEADERLHGLVSRPEEEDGAREPKNAQLRNIQETRGGLEAADGR